MKKKFAALALLMGFTLGLGAIAACGPVDPTDSDVNGSSGQVTPSASVTLSRTALSLDRWGSAVLTAEADAEGTIVWSSADPNVAAVDANGTVTAMGIGSTVITATLSGTDASASCTVTVSEAVQTPVIVFDKQSVNITEGGTLAVSARLTYQGEGVEGASVTYSVADENIASVSAEGVVTGLDHGQTRLIASAEWRGETFVGSVGVTVNVDGGVSVVDESGAVVTSVTLRSSLPEGTDPAYVSAVRFTPVVTYEGETIEADVAVEADRDGIVRIDENDDGTVTLTALSVGNAVVTASAELDGAVVTAQVSVAVVLPDIVLSEPVVLSKTDESTYADIGKTAGISGTVVRVEAGGSAVASGADVSGFVLSHGNCARTPFIYEGAQIVTEDCIYRAEIQITADYDEVDLTVGGGVSVTQGSGNVITNPDSPGLTLWTPAAEEEIVGDREGVMKYSGEGSGIAYRVDILNWPQNGGYAYWAFDFYLTGNAQINATPRTPDIWIEPGVGQVQNPARSWYCVIDADGNLVQPGTDAIQADTWYTLVAYSNGTVDPFSRPTSMLYGQTVGDAFYIDNMRYYTAEGYNLIYTTERPTDAVILIPGESYTYSEEDFEVYFANEQTEDFEIELTSGNADALAADGLTVTGGQVSGETSVTLTVTISAGGSSLSYEIPVIVVPATHVSETVVIDKLDPSTYVLESDEISGNILSVSVGTQTYEGADLTDWVNSLERVSLRDVETNAIVRTDGGSIYSVPLTVTAQYDEVDLAEDVIVTGGDGLWTAVGDESVAAGREGVYRFSSEAIDDNNAFRNNVTINHWPQNAGYGYFVFDFYIAEGTTGFRADPRGDGEIWTEPRVDQSQNPARNWYYTLDEDGERTMSLEAGKWYTLVMFSNGSSAVPFSKPSFAFYPLASAATEFYIDDVRYYTAEKFDPALAYFAGGPEAGVSLGTGQELTYSEDDFTVMAGADRVTDFELSVESDNPEALSVDGLTVTAQETEEDTPVALTFTIAFGGRTFTYTVMVTVLGVPEASAQIDKLDPSTYTLGFEGLGEEEITSVSIGGETVSESADLTDWVNSLERVSLQDVEVTATVTTEGGRVYRVALTVTAQYDEVDLSVSTGGVTVTQNGTVYDGTGENTLWTEATDAEVTAGREGVMKFESDGPTSAWSSNVTINNWPQNAGYYYWTFDFYIAEGTSGFRCNPRTPGELWTEPRVDQAQNPARNWYYTLNMAGEKVTSLEAGTWYTMVMFVSPTSSANGPFVKASASLYGLVNGEATTFYIDNMRYYTAEKFDFLYLAGGPDANVTMTAGQTLVYSEDDFTVMEGGSVQGNLELVGIVSDAPEIISVNGLAVTMHAVEEDETVRLTFTLRCGETTFSYVVTVTASSAMAAEIDILDPDSYILALPGLGDDAITSVKIGEETVSESADLTEWVSGLNITSSLTDEEVSAVVGTESGKTYDVLITVFKPYDEVDFTLGAGIRVTEGSGNVFDSPDEAANQSVWTPATDAEIIGDREGVMRFYAPQGGLQYRIDILTWPQNQEYDYWVFDIYVPEGSLGLNAAGRNPGELWINPQVGQVDKGAWTWFYMLEHTENGLRRVADQEIVKSDVWYTIVVVAGGTNDVLAKTSAVLCGKGTDDVYYVDNMRFYTAEKFDLYTE